jgi:UrcA family protein
MDRKLLAVVSATAFLGAALTSPGAASAQDQAQMRVAIGGVDLRSKAGAEGALRRIETASDRFCENWRDQRDIGRRALARECAQRMTYLAVRELDAPMVTARYEQRTDVPILLARSDVRAPTRR